MINHNKVNPSIHSTCQIFLSNEIFITDKTYLFSYSVFPQMEMAIEVHESTSAEGGGGGGGQRGGMHTNERSHVKLITIGSNGLHGRR